MSQPDSVMEQNRELAERINHEAKQNPNSQSAGKFVGIANGQVVVIADTLREALQRLREVEPDPTKCRCIEASCDYDRLHEI